eukprot:3093277-Karenia_brevis.AAC.1
MCETYVRSRHAKRLQRQRREKRKASQENAAKPFRGDSSISESADHERHKIKAKRNKDCCLRKNLVDTELKRAGKKTKKTTEEITVSKEAVSEDGAASSEDQSSSSDEDEFEEKDRYQSAKASFIAKVLSPLMGYGSDSYLQQFVYDLWLWSSIGSAKNAAGITLRGALSGRVYSPEYWRTRHMALVDLQHQIGWPALFITVAPFEWSAPYHEWLLHEMETTLRTRTNLPAAETFHLAHLLLQTAEGLISGTNYRRSKASHRCWHEHILGAKNTRTQTVSEIFGRLEYQDGKNKRRLHKRQTYHGRGTIHLHLLVWLRKAEQIDFASAICGSLPEDNPAMLNIVEESQFDWDRSGWQMRDEPTKWDIAGHRLLLQHPISAKLKHCRAYMPDVLAAWGCHMDVQSGEGRGLVLQYAASYTSKFSDQFATTWLNEAASDHAIARRVLSEYHPLEPEMWMQLASQTLPHTVCTGVIRRYVVPVGLHMYRDDDEKNKIVQEYIDCTWRREETTLVEYLRECTLSGKRRKNDKRRVLVASILYSKMADEYYQQWLALNLPFRTTGELWDERADLVPKAYHGFALCLLKRP